MKFKKTIALFPLSISAYGILYIMFGLLIFGIFGWLAVDKLFTLQQETKRKNLHLAELEISETVTQVITEVRKTAKSFAEWDETLQQLGNSTYYSYWREYRVHAASFFPPYLRSVELYDRHGNAIATPSDKDMPVRIPLPIRDVTLIKQQGKDNLYYVYPLTYDKPNGAIEGYIALQLDFIQALTKIQHFKYVDIKTLMVNAQEGIAINQQDIENLISATIIPNIEFNQLQELMYKTLSRFAYTGASLALLLLFLFIKVFGLPSRHLSQHIDNLRRGDLQLFQNSEKHKLAVAEFEKIRLSLNNYQAQLDSRDAALRENESRLRALLDNVVDGILTIDAQGIIESFNPAIKHIFRLKDQNINGQNITLLLAQSCLDSFHAYTRHEQQASPLAVENTNTCELIGKRTDGTEFPIEIALSKMQVSGLQLYIMVVRDITERKRAEERLVYLANFDGLTGLPNRTLFRDRLHQAVAHAKREERLVAVIFFDLDHFKKINDTLGHHVGDLLLIGAAERLTASVRELDTVARLGGDEFMVILEGIKHVDEITDIVTNLLCALEKPFMLEGQEAFVAASAGVTIYPFDDVDIDDLVRNADTAMFRAKEQGGNTYQYFKAEMNAKAMEKLNLESALRYALDRNEFELYYQPRVSLDHDVVNGMEALLRWHHPQLGDIPPTTFIPLLEETGLIVPVGEWVLKTACEQTRIWHDAGYRHLKVSVNLSVRQFRQKDLVKRFQTIWESCRFNPAFLELEITEGLLIDNMDTAVEILGGFHRKGVHISIDDFGTGYSSLSYLKRFPINTLKIDRSFVHDIIESPDDAVITAAIVAMARSLRLNIIAEGVETKPQLDYFRSLECDEVQGLFFSDPLPVADFALYIEKNARRTPQQTNDTLPFDN